MNAIERHRALTETEPAIRRLAARLLRYHSDQIEDAEQQARLRLLEAMPSYNPVLGCVKGWAYSVARNAILEFRTSLRAEYRQADPLPDNVARNSDGRADAILHKLLTDPEQILTKKKARLLRLYFATDSRADLAAHLGISMDGANERVSRLRRDLRELVAA